MQFPCAACCRSHPGEATSPHPLERLTGSLLHRPHIAAEGLFSLSTVKLPGFSSVAAGRFEVDRVPQRLGGNQILKSRSFEGQAA